MPVLATSQLSDGIHTVEARAYDTTGNENATSITITVNNQAAPDFPADFNKDGTVSIKDLAILLSGYGNDVTEYTNGDCNGDGPHIDYVSGDEEATSISYFPDEDGKFSRTSEVEQVIANF